MNNRTVLTPQQLFEESMRNIARATSPAEVDRAANKAMDRFDALLLIGEIDLAQAGDWAMQACHKATDMLLLIREADKRAAEAGDAQGGD